MATSLNVKPVEIVKPVQTIKCTLMFRIALNVKPVQIINSTTKFKPAGIIRFISMFTLPQIDSLHILSGNVCKSGPLHFGSEKSFPSNFVQETILGHK